MSFIPSKQDRLPLLWFFISALIIYEALMFFFPPVICFMLYAWLVVGLGYLVKISAVPALPKTLAGHFLRWSMAALWPYYWLRA